MWTVDKEKNPENATQHTPNLVLTLVNISTACSKIKKILIRKCTSGDDSVMKYLLSL